MGKDLRQLSLFSSCWQLRLCHPSLAHALCKMKTHSTLTATTGAAMTMTMTTTTSTTTRKRKNGAKNIAALSPHQKKAGRTQPTLVAGGRWEPRPGLSRLPLRRGTGLRLCVKGLGLV